MQSFDVIQDRQEAISLSSIQATLVVFRENESSLNPTDDQFDFSLWAQAVKKQMVESLQRRNKGNIGTKR